ncbi:MAG: LacI family DNA-binding transcriptional regulator [Rhizobiaceae bacterium]|nr:LacI family DNA-binding transcriptional regulator [Rhizobiaceae bacterium]
MSITTIDRVLNGRDKVRASTAQRVLDAAERIGFYAEGAIRARIESAKPVSNLGILLQYRHSLFIKNLAHQLRSAAAAYEKSTISITIEYADDLAPEAVAAQISALGRTSDVIGVMTARHSLISRAIEEQRERGVPTFGMISEITADCSVGYIGVDNWKVGRTAAWAFSNICRKPGKIGIIVGNHRYRSHELNEMGFRSYFRDHSSDLHIIDPVSTWGDEAKAEALTCEMIEREPDLVALYVSGGGIKGALAGLRKTQRGARLVTLGYQLTEETRAALADGTLDVVIAHPVKSLAKETMIAMVGAIGRDPEFTLPTVSLPLEIYTPENI